MSVIVALFTEKCNTGSIQLYKKYGTVQAREAIPGEKITTIIDGEVETTNVARNDQVVVTGLKGEQYIVYRNTFKQRYCTTEPVGKENIDAYPIGQCIAFQLTNDDITKYGDGTTITFLAPWGETMIAHAGDYIASSGDANDIYRIEKETFMGTYRKC